MPGGGRSRSRWTARNCSARRLGNVEAREAAETVAGALGGLSDELREIVELKTYVGLTFHQIAAVTGLPQGTVATRYRSALAKMQSWISRQP